MILSKSQELEKQLAEARGHIIAFIAGTGTIWIKKPDDSKSWIGEHPASNIADCMELAVELDLWPRRRGNHIEVADARGRVIHREQIAPEGTARTPDATGRATMHAVVGAAIILLNAQKKTSA